MHKQHKVRVKKMCFHIKNGFLVKEVALKSPKILMKLSLVDKYYTYILSTLDNQGMIKIIKIRKKKYET